MSFTGFSEEDLKRIKSSDAAPNTGTFLFPSYCHLLNFLTTPNKVILNNS